MGKGYRQGRLGEEIKKIISDMLRKELKDPGLADNMVSVSGVDVTSDGSYATVYITVMPLGGADEAEAKAQAIEALERAKGFIRREIGQKVKVRHVPELIFKIDSALEYGRHIDEIISTLGIENYPDRDEETEEDI